MSETTNFEILHADAGDDPLTYEARMNSAADTIDSDFRSLTQPSNYATKRHGKLIAAAPMYIGNQAPSGSAVTSGIYVPDMWTGAALKSTSGYSPYVFWLNPADFTWADGIGAIGAYAYLQTVIRNTSAPGSSLTLTPGLYPVTACGGAPYIIPTLGAVVVGSNSTAPTYSTSSSPALAKISRGFGMPALGWYTFGLSVSGTVPSGWSVYFRLAYHHQAPPF